VNDFFSLTARDLNGVDVRLGDIVSNRVTVLLFLRQYGWYVDDEPSYTLTHVAIAYFNIFTST
jgi:hypothetical protein